MLRTKPIACLGLPPPPCCLPSRHTLPTRKPPINSGDTAWLLISSALVLLMTAPGLALFYGGMVRRKNVLATLMQSFILVGASLDPVGAVRLQPGVFARATRLSAACTGSDFAASVPPRPTRTTRRPFRIRPT